ncbi:MAG: SDR family oxidoreductase [Candidatus Glassbacteria bacterium]|nr:SDR family oxidoreductase [Candidatus Glassbacteria bacterium]
MGYNLKRYGSWGLVTGASSGIGLEFARALAAEGLSVALVARRRDRLETLAGELRDKFGVETLVIEQDLSLPDAARSVAGRLESVEVGLLVLNAGFGIAGDFIEQDPERLARMISVNCTSTALLARLILPGMVERRQGAVVLVSSVLGFLPAPWSSAYCATKAFDLMLGESLWPELKPHGIDVLNLCPAMTRTEFHQVTGGPDSSRTRKAEPEDIVHLALKGLGRSLTVFPADGAAASVLTRLLPRKWTAGLAGRVMRMRKRSRDGQGS